jgi:hypothetical protein
MSRRGGHLVSSAHTRSLGGEAPHEPSAEEPGAAEHGDRGHGISCSILDQGGLIADTLNLHVEPRFPD